MTKRFWLLGAALGVLALTVPGAVAEDKKAADREPQKEEDAVAVRNLAMAADLAAMGEKMQKPELLVSAAILLRGIHATPGKDKPTVEGGTAEASDAKVSLKDQSDALLRKAQEMARGDDKLKVLIDGLAERATQVTTRGSFGGPRYYHHAAGAGVAVAWNVNFVAGQPAGASVSQASRCSLTLSVTGPRGHSATWTSINPSLNWTPPVTGTYTIRVVNNGPGSTDYTLYHN
jgi:hypothetical protein